MPIEIPVIIIVVAVLVLLGILMSGYVKAPADKAFIISGFHKNPKILIGRAGIKIPFLERKDVLLLKQISIDIKTNGYVPTLDFIGVDIDAVAKVRIMDNEDGLAKASKNFLNMDESQIIAALTDSLQGNMREIIGTIKLKDLNTDRKQFGDQVQQKAQLDMNALGIEIISCNIQRVDDENKLIIALGQDNMSQIQKDASIAKANADRDVAIAQAQAAKEANDARVAADTVIAEKNNELAIKQAELKKISDAKKAEADAAYSIQEQEQRREIETATVNADIAKAGREAELKKQEVAIQEESLNAQVRKKADADRYAVEQSSQAKRFEREQEAEASKLQIEKAAEADKIKTEKAAEADKFRRIAEAEAALQEQLKEAEGIKAKGEAEADAIRAKGEAEARAIEAKGIAEAEAMNKKAEALKKYGQAAITQMIVEKLPQIAEAVAKPYEQIDKITIIGGAGDGGTNSVGSFVPGALAQTMAAMKEATGIDLKDIIEANGKEAKITKNVNITGLETASDDVKSEVAASIMTTETFDEESDDE
jgi:flotillin